MGKFIFIGPGFGIHPDDDGPECEVAKRERIAGELTGDQLWEAVAIDRSLGNDLDALFLLASVSTDECDLGRQFRNIALKAQKLAVDERMAGGK